jgi:hypothetical protein
MRYNKKLLVPALAVSLGLLSFTASRALADGATPVANLTSFHQMVVDQADDHIFLSQAGNGDGIVVTDLSGNYVTTLDSSSGIAGLALHGSKLYAAVPGSDAVDVFDAATVSSSQEAADSFPLGSGDVPDSLAVQGGELWVSYTNSDNAGGIGSVDLSSGTFTPAANGSWPAAPDLAADPSDPDNGGTLVAAEGATAATFTVTGGVLTAEASPASLASCSAESQLAVVPGGDDFYAVCGTTVSEYSTKDLSTGSSHAGSSVAVSADGSAIAVGDGSTINVYGSSGLLNIENTSDSAAAGGLAWDDTRLDAVTGSSGSYSVQTFDSAATTAHTFTLAPPSSAYVGYVPLTGTLKFSNDELPSGTQVTITRASANGTASTTVGTATVGSDGSYALTDTAALSPGSYTYTAEYGNLPAQTTTVTVAANAVSTFTFNVPATAQITKNYTLSGSVALLGGPARAGTKVDIVRTFGTQVKDYTATVNANGGFSIGQAVGATGTFTFTAKYEGDPGLGVPASSSVTGKLNVVKMTPAMSLTGPTQYTYRPKTWVTVHLGPTYTNRTVSVYVQTAGSSSKKLLAKGTAKLGGTLTVPYTTSYSSIFTVVFGGDAHYAAVTMTRTVTVAAHISFSMTGYYGGKKINGINYRLYHHNAHLNVDTTIGPNRYGECVWFEVQEFYNGAWHSNKNTSCAALNALSTLPGYLTFTNADLGSYYRIRAHYLPASTKENIAANVSGWQYLVVLK